VPSRPATGSLPRISRHCHPRSIADTAGRPVRLRPLPDYGDRGEEDATITPAGPLGSRYAVALARSFLGYADDMDQASAMLQEAMDADRYWPTPGASATTATPTASTPGRRDQAPGPLQDWARAQGAVPLVRLRRDWLLPASVGVLGSRRPLPRWSVTAGTGWVPRLARSAPARPITADPAVCSPANTRASTRAPPQRRSPNEVI
jgi:hypothetical protein